MWARTVAPARASPASAAPGLQADPAAPAAADTALGPASRVRIAAQPARHAGDGLQWGSSVRIHSAPGCLILESALCPYFPLPFHSSFAAPHAGLLLHLSLSSDVTAALHSQCATSLHDHCRAPAALPSQHGHARTRRKRTRRARMRACVREGKGGRGGGYLQAIMI